MDLTALINTYRGPLIGLIASWGAPWADASEIAQDSFSEAWLNRESCRGDWKEPEVFGRWLRGVASIGTATGHGAGDGGDHAWSRSHPPASSRSPPRLIPHRPKISKPCGMPSRYCPPGSARWC